MTEPTSTSDAQAAPESNYIDHIRHPSVLQGYVKFPGLNLGCGITPIRGWSNADLYNDPEIRFDLRKPWPLEDDSFNTIYAAHTLEHFSGEDIFHIFWEAGRVLRSGGHFIGITPYGYSDMQFSALHHKTPWLPGTADVLTTELWESNSIFKGMKQGSRHHNWEKIFCQATVTKPFRRLPTWLYRFCSRHLLNVHEELLFVLKLRGV